MLSAMPCQEPDSRNHVECPVCSKLLNKASLIRRGRDRAPYVSRPSSPDHVSDCRSLNEVASACQDEADAHVNAHFEGGSAKLPVALPELPPRSSPLLGN